MAAIVVSSTWTRVPPARLVVGALEHVLHGGLVVGPPGPVAPVLGGQLPGLERVVATALEPVQLLLLTDVQPELDEDDALGGQRAFVGDDLVVGPLPLLVSGEALHPLDEDPPVPGPVHHRHAAPAGQHGAEPQEEVVALLVGRRGAEARHPHVTGVERRGEAADGPALAGRVPALEQHAHRWPQPAVPDLPAEGEAQLQQAALGRLHLPLLLLPAERLGEVELVQAAH
jgi:hypothetical protein